MDGKFKANDAKPAARRVDLTDRSVRPLLEENSNKLSHEQLEEKQLQGDLQSLRAGESKNPPDPAKTRIDGGSSFGIPRPFEGPNGSDIVWGDEQGPAGTIPHTHKLGSQEPKKPSVENFESIVPSSDQGLQSREGRTHNGANHPMTWSVPTREFLFGKVTQVTEIINQKPIEYITTADALPPRKQPDEIAATVETLPPLQEGYRRVVHLTKHPHDIGIRETGLRYRPDITFTSTIPGDPLKPLPTYASDDPRFSGQGSVAIVMDIPEGDAYLHRITNVEPLPPQIVPPHFLVGIIDVSHLPDKPPEAGKNVPAFPPEVPHPSRPLPSSTEASPSPAKDNGDLDDIW